MTLLELFERENCTEQERKYLTAFLFAFRYSGLNMFMVENIIKKYIHLL